MKDPLHLSSETDSLKDSVAILGRLSSHRSKARKFHQNHRVPSPLHKLDTPSEDSQRSFLLQIKDASLVRGTNPIISHLTLEINEHRVGLIGDNGAGKSSLFRMICGLDVPQSGSVMVRDLQAHQVSKKRPGLVGMMFQNSDDQIIFPTVAEELALGFSPSGISRQDGIARSRSFLESRGLAHWSDRSINSLSQGQRQHVCWLALMIASPELLLLDAGIVRHRGKIESTINNAQRAQEMRREFGTLAAYFWQFEPEVATRPSQITHQILSGMSTSAQSIDLSKDLRKRGWSFVGPTTMYAFMQAMGLVNDHIEGCAARGRAAAARTGFKPPTALSRP